MKKVRAVFMGTPDFAVPCLAKLMEYAEVVGVVTQPDKPRGRGQKLTPSPVKAFAVENGLTVYQPAKVKTPEFVEVLKGLAPELIIVVAFGQILSQEILDIPAYGCINVHASLLPRYRGCAPIQWAVINGEKKSGVTTMFMDAGLDTGDMLLKSEVEITPEMSAAELFDVLMNEGAAALGRTIEQILAGTIVREKQPEGVSEYAPMLTKELGYIDWQQGTQKIHDLIRGLDSWPGAYTFLEGEKYKIWSSRVADCDLTGKPGEFLGTSANGFYVATGDGVLEIVEIQAPNKKRMAASDYLRGHAFGEKVCFE